MTVRILTGDVRERLADLPDGSVQCVVTSPPYFGLRDYGTAQWDGGDPACDHVQMAIGMSDKNTLGPDGYLPASNAANVGRKLTYRHQCRKCGAVRIDNQIGLEPTLAEYVQTMVDVFREVRRVLHPTGVVFCNLGDSYAANRSYQVTDNKHISVGNDMPMRVPVGLKPKDLMMVPARVALALQDDGWYLRSDIIWAKRNCMPESVTDRPTSSHEHIFLLTKNARYFYDAEAVKEEATDWGERDRTNGKYQTNGGGIFATHKGLDGTNPAGRNQRNVWHLATEPFPEAHFATFPTEIPRRCIKAGTSEKGQCPACGAPWRRVVERLAVPETAFSRGTPSANVRGVSDSSWKHIPGARRHLIPPQETIGWSPSCTCNDPGEPVPQTVLDPFAGAGTTLLVADQLGRHGVGIELNPAYAEMARKRIYNDAPLFTELVAD